MQNRVLSTFIFLFFNDGEFLEAPYIIMLSSLAFIFILGLGLASIVEKLRLPRLVGMLIAGMALGPFALDLVAPSIIDISLDIRKMALIVILIRAGLALNLKELKQVGRPAILMSFIPACFEMLVVVLAAPALLGISKLDAAIVGVVLAAVSPAVIVPKMLNLMDKKIGTNKSIPQMIMSAGTIDDLFLITLFTVFTGMAMGDEFTTASLGTVPIAVITGLIVGIIVGYGLCIFFRKYHIRDSIKVIIIMAISFLLVTLEGLLEEIIPFSGLLAVMALGIALLQFYAKLAFRLSDKFAKIWIVAEILLFVLVGVSLDINYALSAGLPVVALIFLALIGRMVGVYLSLLGTKLNYKEKLFCMLAYIPKATVQAAIGSIPLAIGLDCGAIVLTVAVLSILITAPLGAFAIDLTYKKLLTKDSL